MRSSLRRIVAAACLAVLVEPLACAAPGRNKSQEEKLSARIERERNPGKKARLQLRLAKVKLAEADAAYRARDFEKGKALLQQYLHQVRRSWATLQGADNAIRKHMGAFKALEISLRENDRFLEDLRHRVPYPESEAIKAIAKESSVVHNEVLEAIFPAGFHPKRRKNRLLHPRRPLPAKPDAVKS